MFLSQGSQESNGRGSHIKLRVVDTMKTVFKKGDLLKVVANADYPNAIWCGRFLVGQRILVLDSVFTVRCDGDTLCLHVLTWDTDDVPYYTKVWSDEADFVKVEPAK